MTSNDPHAGHAAKHNRQRAFRGVDMLKPRTCEGCRKEICCYYGQKAVNSPAATSGVWLLHPGCEPPRKVTS